MSNRDPLGEFAEQFVAAISGGKLATSRVQQGWDVVLLDGKKVQLKSLSNPSVGAWPNEHTVHEIPWVAWYALVPSKTSPSSGS